MTADDLLNKIIIHLEPVDLILVILLHLAIRFVIADIQQINEPDDDGENEEVMQMVQFRPFRNLVAKDWEGRYAKPERGPANLNHHMIDGSEEENLLVKNSRNMVIQYVEIHSPGLPLAEGWGSLERSRLVLQIPARLVLAKRLSPLCLFLCVKSKAGDERDNNEK